MPVLDGERTRRVTNLHPLAIDRWQIDKLQELDDESFGFFEEIVHSLLLEKVPCCQSHDDLGALLRLDLTNDLHGARDGPLRSAAFWPRRQTQVVYVDDRDLTG